MEQANCEGESRKRKTAWFPNASIIKTSELSESSEVTILLFYMYMRPLWSDTRTREACTWLEKRVIEYKLGGRLRVSREGMNATISGAFQACRDFSVAISDFDERFKETDFKFIDNLARDRMFKDCRVLPVKELVFYDIDIEETMGGGGKHLDANAFHAKLKDNNTVIIDVRNAYETDIGRFEKQQEQGGAELILPDMRKSTDFVPWIKSEKTKERLKGKDVLMYCTGGVRCERASALLKKEVGENAVGDVYQLQGGIEKYLQSFPDGGFFRGKNFVFDKREAIGPNCVNGVGGMLSGVEKVKKKKGKKDKGKQLERDNKALNDIVGTCCICNSPWDRYIGKKKCDTCAVPVLVCQNCCSELGKQKKGQGQEIQAKFSLIRCPLCTQQNCTIRASDLEFTDNGKRTKLGTKDEGASSTVCKWGGGHSKKKEKKVALKKAAATSQKLAFADKPCRFGEECDRSDCWFKH